MSSAARDRVAEALKDRPRKFKDPRDRVDDGTPVAFAEVFAADVIALAEPHARDETAAALLLGAKGAVGGAKNPRAVRVHQQADDLHHLLALGKADGGDDRP